MKNIFKKNQIIITALAIMIAIAGYLSFTNNDKPDDLDSVQTANPDLEDYDVVSELDGLVLVTDITTEDDLTDITDDINATEEDDTEGINAETTAVDENDETVPADTDDGNELGDISDDDILATAKDVSDTGELKDKDSGVPGEAVLASSTIDAGYFFSAKLSREQTRSLNKETLLLIITSTDISDAAKQDAINGMIELTAIAEKENATEISLGARGFEDSVVSIEGGSVEVVVNAANLTDQQIAIIEDVVKRKTDIKSAEDIVITPVIFGE